MSSQIYWPSGPGGSGFGPTPFTIISEQHLTGTAQTYSSLPGLATGDCLILFTSGTYRAVTEASAGLVLLSDTGPGGSTAATSVFARFVGTTLPTTVAGNFTGSDAGNASCLLIVRGLKYLFNRSQQTYSSASNTTPLTFPATGLTATHLTAVPQEAFVWSMYFDTATPTITPTPTATIVHTVATFHHTWLHRVPYGASYSGTVTPATYKSGNVIEVGY